jgi:hypothetical protein
MGVWQGGGHGLLKVSLGPTMPYASTSCGQPPLKRPHGYLATQITHDVSGDVVDVSAIEEQMAVFGITERREVA